MLIKKIFRKIYVFFEKWIYIVLVLISRRILYLQSMKYRKTGELILAYKNFLGYEVYYGYVPPEVFYRDNEKELDDIGLKHFNCPCTIFPIIDEDSLGYKVIEDEVIPFTKEMYNKLMEKAKKKKIIRGEWVDGKNWLKNLLEE